MIHFGLESLAPGTVVHSFRLDKTIIPLNFSKLSRGFGGDLHSITSQKRRHKLKLFIYIAVVVH